MKSKILITQKFVCLFVYGLRLFVETERGIFDAVLQGDIDFESEPWPSISYGAKDLVRKMLIQDPKKRITAPQVLGSYLNKFLIDLYLYTPFNACGFCIELRIKFSSISCFIQNIRG